jgi:hypothetical protein
MRLTEKKNQKIVHDRRWREVDALLRPLGPASAIVRRLYKEHGITLSLRAVYNWRARGVSESCAPAVAKMAGKSVEEVLRASGKL